MKQTRVARLLATPLQWLTTMCVVSSVLSITAEAQTVAARDLRTLVESGVLRVAMTKFNLPAFHWRADGPLAGPEIDLAMQIGRALAVRVEFIDTASSFNGVVDTIAAGDADIGISKLSQTYTRLQRVRFSQPYVTLQHALLFDRAAISALSEGRSPEEVLRKFKARIGVIRGSSYFDFARKNFPEARIVEAANWGEAIEGLLAHRVDAIYRDEFEIRRVLKTRPALNVHFGAAVITDQKDFLSIAICDTCIKLQEFVNYHLNQTAGTFTMQRLLSANLLD